MSACARSPLQAIKVLLAHPLALSFCQVHSELGFVKLGPLHLEFLYGGGLFKDFKLGVP